MDFKVGNKYKVVGLPDDWYSAKYWPSGTEVEITTEKCEVPDCHCDDKYSVALKGNGHIGHVGKDYLWGGYGYFVGISDSKVADNSCICPTLLNGHHLGCTLRKGYY